MYGYLFRIYGHIPWMVALLIAVKLTKITEFKRMALISL